VRLNRSNLAADFQPFDEPGVKPYNGNSFEKEFSVFSFQCSGWEAKTEH
jgi:hypothetical protein